jgi:hypothetical protein
MAKTLGDRVDILERALGSALAIDLSGFDPEAVKAKQEAEAKVAKEREKEEQAKRDEESARLVAEAEAAEKAEAAIAARTKAILEDKNKSHGGR